MTAGRRVSNGAQTADRPLVAVLAGISIVLVLGVVATSAALLRERDLEASRADTAALASSEMASGALRVGVLTDALDALAEVVVDGGPSMLADAEVPGLSAVAWLPADDGRSTVRLTTGSLAVADVRPALDRARDSGETVLSAPVGEPGIPVVTFALYDVDGLLARDPSRPTTATRRSELAGHLVAPVDVTALASGPERLAWRLVDGPRTLASAGSVSGDVVETELDVLGRRWTLATAVRAVPIVDRTSGTLALLGALLVGLLLFIGFRSQHERRVRRREVAAAGDRATAIVTLSGVVQESNELAEILPALSVQLFDHLGIVGLSLATVGGGGTSREVFVHGQRPDPGARPRQGMSDHAVPGETLALHLHRAERSIGVLRVVAGRKLSPADVELLDISAEMITSAVATSRSLEQQLEALSRLQALDQLKSAFLGTASHELRTPVTAISGFAFLLAERWDSLGESERRVFVERIASNARSLDALVQDLLDFARLERGDHEMDLRAVDLSELVVRVLDRSAPVWSTHVIERSVPPGGPVWARGDVAPLERVVTNLVSNAVKFSPAGSEVRVTVERGDRPRLIVDDKGPGVPEEERDKIFVRFFRGGGEAVVRTRGVGIGLSLVDDFVTRMGGHVIVDSSPDGGARFVIELEPAADAARPEQEQRDVAST